MNERDIPWKTRLRHKLEKDEGRLSIYIQGGGARGAWEAGILAGRKPMAKDPVTGGGMPGARLFLLGEPECEAIAAFPIHMQKAWLLDDFRIWSGSARL